MSGVFRIEKSMPTSYMSIYKKVEKKLFTCEAINEDHTEINKQKSVGIEN